MKLRPTQLEVVEKNRLRIVWSDGQIHQIPLTVMRDNCPCATCREKRQNEQAASTTDLPILSAAETQPLRLNTMNPVGNYAYSIGFSDGHDTGIFTLEFLRALGTAIADAKK